MKRGLRESSLEFGKGGSLCQENVSIGVWGGPTMGGGRLIIQNLDSSQLHEHGYCEEKIHLKSDNKLITDTASFFN